MVHSPAVDWFPHPSPDGREITFIRYPAGTTGHPPDKDVEIWHLVVADGILTQLASFLGGQGSFNVNSWSPDGAHIAYVAYPAIDAGV
jgi:Tol biopolymer transport system component